MLPNLHLYSELDGPAFLVGDRIFFSKDRLCEVQEEIISDSY